METKSASDTSSIKSTPGSKPGTPGVKKQVGFTKARPKLIIPSPNQELRQNWSATATPRTIGRTPVAPQATRKPSAFVFEQFNGIRDFTKSGLGLGEKCSLWCYNKVRSWSRKWFTHMFLTIVLILYTIAGAVVFKLVEGQSEDIIRSDLFELRKSLANELRSLAIVMPEETSEDEWAGTAVRKIREYESTFLEWHSKHKLYVTSTKKEEWTFSHSVVFCATIYTSIAPFVLSLNWHQIFGFIGCWLEKA